MSKLSNIKQNFIVDYSTSTLLSLTKLGQKQANLIIPKEIKYITSNTFKSNKILHSVTFEEGSQLQEIGESAFEYCSSLEKVTFEEGSQLKTIGSDAFKWCNSLQSITIPDSVKEIGDRTFRGCESLESIIIPSSVTSIGECAFYKCYSLRSVTFEEGSKLKFIGASAFEDCENLEKVTFEEGSQLKEIGEGVFVNSDLNFIVIPKSVQSIGKYAFAYCPINTQYYVPTEQIKQLLFKSNSEISNSQIIIQGEN